AALTQQGTIVGTFQYMAPELLQGQEAHPRSDIFSFGCVLYEMVTGRRAFEGKTQLSVMSAILEKEPEPLSNVQPTSPAALDYALRTCLEKNPDDRFQTAHDVKLQLAWIAKSPSQTGAPALPSSKLRPKLWLAAIAVLALRVIALVVALAGSAPQRVLRVNLLPPEGTRFETLSSRADNATSDTWTANTGDAANAWRVSLATSAFQRLQRARSRTTGCTDIRKQLLNEPPGHSTMHQEIVTLRQVLKTALRHGWLDHLPDFSEPYRSSSKISHRAWFSNCRKHVRPGRRLKNSWKRDAMIRVWSDAREAGLLDRHGERGSAFCLPSVVYPLTPISIRLSRNHEFLRDSLRLEGYSER
ncbi:MAG: protein kinase, partial [Candidatus Sulfotelmatobacter sp.]